MRNAACMIILNENGLVLSISRRNDKTKFGLPGGKVEDNETIKDAAIRETFEETGIKVTSCIEVFKREEPRGTPDGEDFFCTCFYATNWSGTPQNSEEGEVAWLSEEELTGNMGAFPTYNAQSLRAIKELNKPIFQD